MWVNTPTQTGRQDMTMLQYVKIVVLNMCYNFHALEEKCYNGAWDWELWELWVLWAKQNRQTI